MIPEKYTILQKLSEGSVTTVYKASQNALGRTVLLKVLHRHLLGDRELVERLRREAAACASLKSDHIVQVYTLDEFEGSPAIVMEFVEGMSLSDYLLNDGDRSEDFARTVAASVLKGLSAAHAHGVIHRDIKPANLMIASDGSVRITDFGLAGLGTSSTLTAEGVLIGTPAYMSPEQAGGEAPDHRTDFFSLGVTLVEILSARQIFHGSSYNECINKILRFRAQDLDAAEFNASPGFRAFVKGLMAEDREQRYASAEDALAGLESDRLLAPVVGRPRRRLRLTAAAVAFVAVAALAWVLLPRQTPDTLPASSGQSPDVLPDSATPPSTVPPPAGPPEAGSRGTRARLNEDTGREAALAASTDAGRPDAAEAAATDSADITLSCSPWGKVYVDGTYVGTTPVSGAVRVAAGQHTVTFTHPHFEPVSRLITVRANEPASVDADFLRTAGYLHFSIRPWAEIFVDDQYRETSPVASPLVVSAGTRTIRLHHPSYPDRIIQASVGVGDTVRVSHVFTTEAAP